MTEDAFERALSQNLPHGFARLARPPHQANPSLFDLDPGDGSVVERTASRIEVAWPSIFGQRRFHLIEVGGHPVEMRFLEGDRLVGGSRVSKIVEVLSDCLLPGRRHEDRVMGVPADEEKFSLLPRPIVERFLMGAPDIVITGGHARSQPR